MREGVIVFDSRWSSERKARARVNWECLRARNWSIDFSLQEREKAYETKLAEGRRRAYAKRHPVVSPFEREIREARRRKYLQAWWNRKSAEQRRARLAVPLRPEVLERVSAAVEASRRVRLVRERAFKRAEVKGIREVQRARIREVRAAYRSEHPKPGPSAGEPDAGMVHECHVELPLAGLEVLAARWTIYPRQYVQGAYAGSWGGGW